MYKCNECNAEFEKPLTVTEQHGLDTPPYEKLEACPRCRTSTDFSALEGEEYE